MKKLKIISLNELKNSIFIYNLLNLVKFIKKKFIFLDELFLVGGGFRRCFTNRKIAEFEFDEFDLDFVCNDIFKIKKLFHKFNHYNVKLFSNSKSLRYKNIQVNQLRGDIITINKIEFVFNNVNLCHDYLRRDFTLNGIFFLWSHQKIFYFDNSLEDLIKKKIEIIDFNNFKFDCSKILRYITLIQEDFDKNFMIEEYLSQSECINLIREQNKRQDIKRRILYEKKRIKDFVQMTKQYPILNFFI